MALHLPAKAPGDVLDYTWQAPFDECDGLASYTAEITGATIDEAGTDGDDVVLVISGGTAGATAVLTLSAVSNDGDTFTETVYLPIRATTNAFAYTVRDICGFALRPITGVRRDPTAAEMDDAIERLQDMLAKWVGEGADIGVPLPLTAEATLYLPDSDASALRNNLILELADLYGKEPSGRVIQNARTGLQAIKARNLPAEREGAEFF